MRFAHAAALALASATALAKDVSYNFTVGWVTANPDGMADRQVIGINGQWPLPTIEANEGDHVTVTLYNDLKSYNASIHFHGLFMNGTNAMDGPVPVTQCPVAPGSTFVYEFDAQQVGTYWYHSHIEGQYPDGYRGPLIIRAAEGEPTNSIQSIEGVNMTLPYEWDDEITITLSDWYHELIPTIEPTFLSLYNPTGAEPIPDAFLFNDGQLSKVPVEPGTKYLVRIINLGAFVGQYFYIEDHDFQVVEVDGVYTEPANASTIYISAAQRYAILLETKNSTDRNYGIVTIADSSLLDTIPSDLELNQTNWLQYNSSASFDEVEIEVDSSDDLEFFDDTELVPADGMDLLPEPDMRIEVNVIMNNLLNGYNYAFFNNISYTAPKVPTLYTVMSAGNLSTDSTVYGEYTHPYVLNAGDVVEVVLNNQDSGKHPFHLHGHTFQAIWRSQAYDDDNMVSFEQETNVTYPDKPMRRDTLVVNPNGNFVIRFRADNPGVWFFHCHIEWHILQGLAMTFVEAPLELQKQTIPQGHIDACKAVGMSYEGNAAANTENLLDLTGQNTQVDWLPAGFTARGIVALVFSCVAAFLGMASIVWYGLSDLSLSERKIIERVGAEDDSLDVDNVSNHNGRDE